MIKSIKFKADFGWAKDEVIFPAGLEIALKPGVNILTGDQGTGKSTLIELLRSLIEKEKPRKGFGRVMSYNGQTPIGEIIEVESDVALSDLNLVALDFERDASRDKGYFDWDGPLGGMFQVGAMRASHGQSNRAAFNQLTLPLVKVFQEKGEIPPTLAVLDEPDAALSIKSITGLHASLLGLTQKLKAQVIVSAHHPFLIGCFKDVYSMEQQDWITREQYFENQLEGQLGKLFLERYVGI